jgi:hypothetical protein
MQEYIKQNCHKLYGGVHIQDSEGVVVEIEALTLSKRTTSRDIGLALDLHGLAFN